MSSAPLLSWDIFMPFYQTRISRLEDLKELNKFSRKNDWIVRWNLEDLLLRLDKVILVTDPHLSICYASSNMIEMNGYQAEDVKGKSPAIFQGVDTSINTKEIIRKAISTLQPFHVSMINYKKNGTPYQCDIESFPVFSKNLKHSHFIAFEKLAEA